MNIIHERINNQQGHTKQCKLTTLSQLMEGTGCDYEGGGECWDDVLTNYNALECHKWDLEAEGYEVKVTLEQLGELDLNPKNYNPDRHIEIIREE